MRVKRLLIVEDEASDVRAAADVARSLGIDFVDARFSVSEAENLLRKGLRREVALPDAILLDLDLGTDSGFELMRYWHKTHRLATIPVIVWSRLDDKRELCRLLGVNAFVCKEDGAGELRQALTGFLQPAA